MHPYKKYNPDPQTWWDDEPEIPEVDDNDEFDIDLDDSKEEMIEREGINADNNGMY